MGSDLFLRLERTTGEGGRRSSSARSAITFDHEGSLWITSLGNGIRRVPYPERLHPPKIRDRLHGSSMILK